MTKVSIVMPVYNGEKYLRQALDSIVEQEYTDWELYIVNDCSIDNSLSIMQEYEKKDKRIKIINNKVNEKLPKSLNIGFQKTVGKYRTWTSDDNIYDKKAILKMVQFLDNNPDIGLVYTDEYYIDENDDIIKKVQLDVDSFFYQNCVGASFMYRTEVANKIGEYDLDMFLIEDYDYWFRMRKITRFGRIPECLYYYRVHQNSLSTTRYYEVKKVFFKLREKNLSFILENVNQLDKEKMYCELWTTDREKTKKYKNMFWKNGLPENLKWLEREETMDKDKKYILFGTGLYGKKAIEFLGKEKVYCYVDNNKELVGKEKNGKLVIDFEELKKIYTNYQIVLSVGPKNMIEIANQLEQAGIVKFITYFELLHGKKNPNKIGCDVDWVDTVNRAGKWVIKNTIENKGIINTTENTYAYPEVSGYYIPTLLEWGYRDLAIQYAKWLCEIQHEDGSWYDTLDEKPYIFDTAQILKGLIAIRKILPEVDSYIIKGCDWLVSNVDAQGRLVPVTPIWGQEEGICSELIHLYCLSPLMEAGKIYNQRYSKAAEHILNYYINNYTAQIMDFGILSHFYGYVMEALCDLDKKELARQAMNKLEMYQKEDGAIPAYKNVDFVCSTGMIQLAIVWYKLGEKEKGDKILTYVAKLQNESGGWYGSYAITDVVDISDKRNFPTYIATAEISWAVKYFLDAVSLKMQLEFEQQASSFEEKIEKDDGRYINLSNEIKGFNSICDIGCGKGRFAKALKDDYKNVDITCIDISNKVMEYIENDFIKLKGALTNIPVESEKYDVVYTIEALEHTLIPENAMEELYRVVKPGGKIIVIDKSKRALERMLIDEWEQYFDDSFFENVAKLHNCKLKIEKKFNKFEDGFFGMWVLYK